MRSQDTNTVIRLNEAWLATTEREAMLAIARRLPPWIEPDHLTLLGIAGGFLAGAGFALSTFSIHFLWIACFGLIMNWVGDSTDGNLARLRKVERPQYGFFVDHSADVLSQLFIFIGLGLSPHMRMDTACFFLLSYWLAAISTFIRALATKVFRISYFGIGPTEIRLALVAAALGLIAADHMGLDITIQGTSPLDIAAIGIFGMTVASFVVLTLIDARKIGVLDPRPNRDTRAAAPVS
jgi:phosphatidylglycerophosphate synthase